jgi:hypothetical protein
MRKLLLALVIGIPLAAPAAAQGFSIDELAPVKTTSGCYYMAHREYGEAQGFRHEWSGACTPGAMISGAGTMTRSWPADSEGRLGVQLTGQLDSGYWEGAVSELIVASQGSGPLAAQGSAFEEFYERGCPSWKLDEDACSVYSTAIPSSSATAAAPAPVPALAASPPAAPAAPAGDSRLIRGATLADLQKIVVEEGYTILSTGDEGEVSVRAKTDEGLVFNLIGTICDSEYSDDCLGINMQVRYDADGRETLERINNANLMWGATSAWYSAGGIDGNTPTVGISRYIILDRGATMGNIKDNLLNLLAIAPQVANYIWQAGEYAPGYVDDEDYWDEEW